MSYGCNNRPPYRSFFPAQSGWYVDGSREDATRTPRMTAVHFRMTPTCQYTHSPEGRTDLGCVGCKWRAE
jgi:hypothetical protein